MSIHHHQPNLTLPPRASAERRRGARAAARLTAGSIIAAILVIVSLVGTTTSVGAAGPADPSPSVDPSASPDPSGSGNPSPSASASPTPPAPLPGPFTIYGRGYGHGVGMAQYGARGRALAGQTAADILAHYYHGTTLETLDPTAQIRVLVLSGFKATTTAPLKIYGRNGAFAIDGISGTYPADALLTLTPTTTSTGTKTYRLRVTRSDGVRLLDRLTPTDFRVRPTTTAGSLQLWSKPSSYDRYRGVLRVIAKTTITVVNDVRLEHYLRGVVPAEMPYSWPTEALRAQAIAARSYAARRIRAATYTYDVTDDTSSQVYRGNRGEKTETTRAVVDTTGIVLRYGTEIVNAMFHSSDGGATENNEYVYVNSTGSIVAGVVPYLRGSGDRDENGKAYDSASPYATWKTATLSGGQLSAIFAADARTNVGPITKIDLRRKGVSGRLISVTLTGTLGTKKVSGDVFRIVFNAKRPAGSAMMRSTLFDLAPIP